MLFISIGIISVLTIAVTMIVIVLAVAFYFGVVSIDQCYSQCSLIFRCEQFLNKLLFLNMKGLGYNCQWDESSLPILHPPVTFIC